MNIAPAVIEACALEVEFVLARGWRRRILHALRAVDLRIERGEILGVVGESGSGKSTLARALLRLIAIRSGCVRWLGEDVTTLAGASLRRRRRHAQLVFQDPLASLNPRLRIFETLSEPLRIHEPTLDEARIEARVAQMLADVGMESDAGSRFPRQFSGGQCQRIAIARAMILRPALLVCDEPVSSLDVSVQGQIINLFADIRHRDGTAMLFISHNLAVVRYLAARVMVMYLGRVIERADTADLFTSARHPYTRALIAAMPSFEANSIVDARGAVRIQPLGEPPSPLSPPSGCAFRNLCAHAIERCAAVIPALETAAAGHEVACHRWRELG
jgi:oligopeptide transport system ATP-binding protein